MFSLDDYVVDVLMRDLISHDRRLVCFFVYLWLTREQQHRGKAVEISYRELAESIGISKSAAQAAVNWLARRELFSISKANSTAIPRYTVQCPWERREERTQVRGTDRKASKRFNISRLGTC
jgi:hypothetical protein